MSVSETVARHAFAGWRRQRNWNPRHVVRAEGCYFWDADGNRFLDFSAQLVSVNLGHGNSAVREAIRAQAGEVCGVSPGFATSARAAAIRKVGEVVPAGLDKFFFSSSGAAANEAAIKIARAFTGRNKIVARYRSYHGASPTAISVTGDPRRLLNGAACDPYVIFAPECHCRRCPLALDRASCKLACARLIEHVLENEDDVAAVLVEPIVGTNGVLLPADGYLQALRQACDRHDVLLIFDEVMTGWGRTGAWFAGQHWDVRPDILTTAKGLTNAAVPLGLTAATRRVADAFEDRVFPHGHTYESHPLALAAAAAAITEMQRLDLVARARATGEQLGRALALLKSRHPSVVDVRGLGLFWALELAADRAGLTPLGTPADKRRGAALFIDQLAAELMDRGLYLLPWISHFVLAPPLIAGEQEIALAVEALDAVLSNADRRLR